MGGLFQSSWNQPEVFFLSLQIFFFSEFFLFVEVFLIVFFYYYYFIIFGLHSLVRAIDLPTGLVFPDEAGGVFTVAIFFVRLDIFCLFNIVKYLSGTLNKGISVRTRPN